MRSQGYRPFGASREQDEILDEMIFVAKAGVVGVFDLDGCLFDTRQRQIKIFREFASIYNYWELFRIQESNIRDWELRNPLIDIGMSDARIDGCYDKLKKYWTGRFFSNDYVRIDHPMPGSKEIVAGCYQRGMNIVYLTGRDHGMRTGTEDALRANGFPYDNERTWLVTKPDFAMDDSEYKENALEEISKIGRPVLFVDNEPANVNIFYHQFPEATVIFIETDHSPKKDRPDPKIPWIRSWYRTTYPNAELCRASIYI